MDRFTQILYDLGKEIQTDLFVDAHQVCQLNFRDQLSVQLQYHEPKELLLVAAFLCEAPPGKFREKLFYASLIHNDEYPRLGTFAFSESNNQFTFFEFVPTDQLTGEKLFAFLEEFVKIGLSWKDAVEKGDPLPTEGKTNQGGENFFGRK